MKIQNFAIQKTPFRNRLACKIFAKHISDRRIIHRILIYKQHLQVNSKNTNNPIQKKRQSISMDILLKKI